MTKIFKPEELQKMVTIQYDKIISDYSNYWISVQIDEQVYYFSNLLIEHDEELKQITAPFWLIRSKGLETYIIE